MNDRAYGPAGGTTPSGFSEGPANVVGLISRSRDRLLLPRRVARFKKEPSPVALADLVQSLLRLGEVEEAWHYARQGYARFREDEQVRELWRTAGRAHAEHGLLAAQAEIQERPAAHAFLKMARCAVLLRDVETAFRALEECLRRFPTSAPAHAAIAELLEQRWLRDLAAVDGRAVIAHLRKAWRLDGADFSRPLRLAAFLARVGAPRAAFAVVDEVLQIDEQQADAAALRESLAKVIATEVAARRLEDGEEDDVDALLRQIEEQGRVVGDPSDELRVAREGERLCTFLPALRERTGCEKAFVLEPKGTVYDEHGGLGVNPLTSLATNLLRSALITARRADLGPLDAVTLESSGGSLLIQLHQRCAVAVLLDRPEAVEHGRRALVDLADGRLPAAPPRRGAR
jgi:tetratricopeptide (TPR) repeat protein